MIKFRHLEYFVKLCDCGNVQDTAINMCVTKQSVYKAIKELEDIYKSELFSKLTNDVTPTSKGISLYNRSKDLVYSFDDLVSDFPKGSNSHFSLAINNYFMVSFPNLKKDIFDFLFKNQITINSFLEIGNQDLIINKIRNGKTDCGMVMSLGDFKDLWSYEIIKMPAFAFLDIKHPLAKYELLDLEDITDYKNICMSNIEDFYKPLYKIIKTQNKKTELLFEPTILEANLSLLGNKDAVFLNTKIHDLLNTYKSLKAIPVKDIFWKIQLISEKDNDLNDTYLKFGEYIKRNILEEDLLAG